jgi:hypothetical protein
VSAACRWERSCRLIPGLMFAMGLLAGVASAQSVQLQVSEGPYFQAQPVDIHVVAQDFDENPTPEVEFDPPASGRIEFLGVSPNVRSSISIVNGRMTQTKDVRFIYRYRFVPAGRGAVRVGPFRVRQGSVVQQSLPIQLRIQTLGKNDRVAIAVRWPEEAVYPGQRIPVEVEWSFEWELSERMQDYRIEVPIFNRNDLFRYIEERPGQGETSLKIETASGPITMKATIGERTRNGKRFKVVSARRILIPMQPGEFDFDGPTVFVEEVTRWRRDLFGQRLAQSTR